MLKGKMVRIRAHRYFGEQAAWAYVGKVVEMSAEWVVLQGKGVVVLRGRAHPPEIDKEVRTLVFPRESIANIRVLPDNFDMNNIQLAFDGAKVGIIVDGAPDAWVSEVGQG